MNLTQIEPPAAPPESRPATFSRTALRTLALLIVVAGIFLRLYPSAGFTGVGFDEALYRDYLIKIDKVGFLNYPAICEVYRNDQKKPESMAKLPPTRFLYIACSWLWKHGQFGDAPPAAAGKTFSARNDPYLVALHRVSAMATIALLLVGGAWAWRTFEPGSALAILALLAVAPVQLQMSQHALIDGFFAAAAMFALWTLWENLRKPNDAGWLTAHGVALALMVLTKENAFFVYVALGGLLVANRWAHFGTITGRLLAVMVGGPLLGVALLVNLAGGVPEFIEIYQLLVSKAQNLHYAIMTGDGPWHRYLVDYMVVSPVVLCLGIGALFTSLKNNRALIYLSGFIALSYLVMCNVKYGMNLRYATIWDLPLRALAVAQIGLLARSFGRRENLAFTLMVLALCAYELRQYVIFFHDFGLYELASEGLLRAVKILK